MSRIVPSSATYFLRNAAHEATMLRLQNAMNAYVNAPKVARTTPLKWITFNQYAKTGGGSKLKPIEYKELTRLLNSAAQIDPQLVSTEFHDLLQSFQRQTQAEDLDSATAVTKQLDADGVASTRGIKKSAIAELKMARGTGEIVINGRPFVEVFPNLRDRLDLVYPLTVVEQESHYNIWCVVRGGGPTGKKGAIASAIAKAITVHNPLLKNRLYKAGCLTVDNRKVERKKPGKLKARKSPTWVKR